MTGRVTSHGENVVRMLGPIAPSTHQVVLSIDFHDLYINTTTNYSILLRLSTTSQHHIYQACPTSVSSPAQLSISTCLRSSSSIDLARVCMLTTPSPLPILRLGVGPSSQDRHRGARPPERREVRGYQPCRGACVQSWDRGWDAEWGMEPQSTCGGRTVVEGWCGPVPEASGPSGSHTGSQLQPRVPQDQRARYGARPRRAGRQHS